MQTVSKIGQDGVEVVTDVDAQAAVSSIPGFSIVIPAYNEEQGIRPVLEELKRLPAEVGNSVELIVVDDGSRDGTFDVCKQIDGIKLLRHKGNRGYGAALKTGIQHAKHGIICITDADGTYPNEMIPTLISRMISAEVDMVVGARTGKNVAIPLVRRPAKWMIRSLASVVAGMAIPDINSGLRVFRRSTALRFFNLLPDGFSFTTTITLGMLSNGYLVDYVPINYHARVGTSKIRPIHDTLNFIQLVLRIALYFVPLKIFLPLSGILLLISIAWGLATWAVWGQIADVSTVVIAMTAVQVAVTGLLAELVNRRVPNSYYYTEDL